MARNETFIPAGLPLEWVLGYPERLLRLFWGGAHGG